MNPSQRNALQNFVDAIRGHYGSRLLDVVVFGSRARKDHRGDSDLDLAVVLADADFDFWTEKLTLIEMSHDAFFDGDLMIQAWPIAHASWLNPALHSNPRFVREVRRDAKPVGEAA